MLCGATKKAASVSRGGFGMVRRNYFFFAFLAGFLATTFLAGFLATAFLVAFFAAAFFTGFFATAFFADFFATAFLALAGAAVADSIAA
jgi:hypothetical protein